MHKKNISVWEESSINGRCRRIKFRRTIIFHRYLAKWAPGFLCSFNPRSMPIVECAMLSSRKAPSLSSAINTRPKFIRKRPFNSPLLGRCRGIVVGCRCGGCRRHICRLNKFHLHWCQIQAAIATGIKVSSYTGLRWAPLPGPVW